MINISILRHEKERTYFGIMLTIGILFWLILIIATVGIALLVAIPIALSAWIMGLYFKAVIYGDSVKVSSKQYPEIYNLAVEKSKDLNLNNIPDVFITNGNGMANAFAVKFMSKRYIVLMSDVVDLMLTRNKMEELSMIIGHEMGHHAAGHTSTWRNLLIMPAVIIPFIGAAYGRACELTADRIGFATSKNLDSCQNALVSLSLGSHSLANETDLNEFIMQENAIPPLMGFLHNLYSSHPRMTKRVVELASFEKMNQYQQGINYNKMESVPSV